MPNTAVDTDTANYAVQVTAGTVIWKIVRK